MRLSLFQTIIAVAPSGATGMRKMTDSGFHDLREGYMESEMMSSTLPRLFGGFQRNPDQE